MMAINFPPGGTVQHAGVDRHRRPGHRIQHRTEEGILPSFPSSAEFHFIRIEYTRPGWTYQTKTWINFGSSGTKDIQTGIMR